MSIKEMNLLFRGMPEEGAVGLENIYLQNEMEWSGLLSSQFKSHCCVKDLSKYIIN